MMRNLSKISSWTRIKGFLRVWLSKLQALEMDLNAYKHNFISLLFYIPKSPLLNSNILKKFHHTITYFLIISRIKSQINSPPNHSNSSKMLINSPIAKSIFIFFSQHSADSFLFLHIMTFPNLSCTQETKSNRVIINVRVPK